MAQRSKAGSRRDSERPSSDPFEAVKPLVVLVLLGTILYGAYSVIRRGPSGAPADVALATQAPTTPPTTQQGPPADVAVAQPVPSPSPAPPAVQIALPASPPPAMPPSVPTATPIGAPAGVADVAVAPPPAQVLKAAAAQPPVAEAAALSVPVAEPVQQVMPAMPTPPQPASPQRQAAAFAAAWADAHDKLATARYAEALGVLSGWYDDPGLAPEESQRLEELLGQLAGSVIYSQQDLLLPPHIVAAGETLRDIAAPLNVPWQLLAKINGVDAPARIVPGEPLKVVQGPFDAVVSLSRGRLSLQLKGSYAGSFTAVAGRDVQGRVGSSFVVERVRRGGASATQARSDGPVQQASHEEGQGEKRILLDGGFSIDAAEDPVAAADSASGTSLIVSARDLDELVDILGGGSRIFVKP